MKLEKGVSVYSPTGALICTWAIVCSLGFISLFFYGSAGLLGLLTVIGTVISLFTYDRSRQRALALMPKTTVKKHSACVWQLDREA